MISSPHIPIVHTLILALSLFGLVAAPTSAADRASSQPGAAGYIIVLRDDVPSAAAANTAADVGRANGLAVDQVYDVVLKGFAARVPDRALARLRRDPRVASVQPDLPVHAASQILPTGVDRIGADARTEGTPPTQAGRPVAVIDTGIDPKHPDLNVKGGYNCTSKDHKHWADGSGHGTHVAGIIGAKNNGRGVVGVAPGTPLYAVKVLADNDEGRWSWVICGLNWAAKAGLTVANMSLDGPSNEDPSRCTNSALHQAICNATDRGLRIAVAAGNNSRDATLYAPAMYPEVTTVSALSDSDGCAGGLGPPIQGDPDDSLASFSNDGSAVDVAAPGVGIRSTWKNGGYKTLSGTSMAAPHVAAAIALGWDGQKDPGPIPGDSDGFDEGIIRLSANTACT